MDQFVRWGIIGCGDVTEVKSGPPLRHVEGSQLVAVMRRDGALARDYAERHGVPRWYDDAQLLIDDSEVNAVYIATPPDTHLHYTQRVAAAGKPVYVEKPMARTAAEAREMVAACDAAGVALFVAYYRRCLELHLKVRELLDEGAIGQVRLATLRHLASYAGEADAEIPWRLIPEVAGRGGLFHDLASHQLDLLDFLLGPIESVAGVAANLGGHYACDDTIAATWKHEGGAVGSAMWCFVAAAGQGGEDIGIIGSEGRLSFAAFDLERPVRLERGDRVEEFAAAPPAHVQGALIQSVVDALLGRGTCPSTGSSALRTAEVMDAILGTG